MGPIRPMNALYFSSNNIPKGQVSLGFLQIKTPSFAARGRVITFNFPSPGVRARFKCAESVSPVISLS